MSKSSRYPELGGRPHEPITSESEETTEKVKESKSSDSYTNCDDELSIHPPTSLPKIDADMVI